MTTIDLKWHGLARPWRNILVAAILGLVLIGATKGLAPLYGRSAHVSAEGQGTAAVSKHPFDDTALQRQLGWHAAIAVTDIDPRVVTVLLLDRNGAPLPTEAVVGEVRRSGMMVAVRAVSFAPAGPNLWRATLGELGQGNWDLRIEILRPDGPAYRAEWHLQIRNAAAT